MNRSNVENLIDKKNYSQALSVIDKHLDNNEFDIVALSLKAKVLYRMQEFEKAIQEYNKLINLDPVNLDHLADRGLSFHMSGNHDRALNDFDEVIRQEPENPYWYACRAFIKDYIKDFQGSLADYDKALELDPEDAISLNNKGLVEEKLGYAEKAEKSFAKADELEGIDLEKEIGHLNIPIEEESSVAATEQAPGAPINPLRLYLKTIRALFTSSSERQAFLDFLLRRNRST